MTTTTVAPQPISAPQADQPPQHCVTIHDLAVAFCAQYIRPAGVSAKAWQATASERADTFNRCLEEFGTTWNVKIDNYYFCSSLCGGIVISRRFKSEGMGRSSSAGADMPSPLMTPYPPSPARAKRETLVFLDLPGKSHVPAWISELLLECNHLLVDIRDSLNPWRPTTRLRKENVFTLAVQLLKLADSIESESSDGQDGHTAGKQTAPGAAAKPTGRKSPHPDLTEQPAMFRKQLDDERESFVRAATRQARAHYYEGMLMGLALLALITSFIAGYDYVVQRVPFLDLPHFPVQDVLTVEICVFSGGIGAIVSVMQRTTKNNLTLPYREGPMTLKMVGAFRPLIGAIIAAAIYVLMVGEAIPVKIPTTLPFTSMYFFAGVSFLAGFSERFARDLLEEGQRAVTAAGKTT